MNFGRNKIAAGIILLVLCVLAVTTSRASISDGLLHISFLDVGQGDAIFIQAPNGNQVLIDGGPDDSILQELGRVMPFYDSSIDTVIVSHPHADHIGGLDDVLERYDVGLIIEARETYDSGEFRSWKKAVANENAQQVEAIAGTQLRVGTDMVLTILHPFASVAGTTTDTPHEDSVVTMLQYKNFKLLLTGDMESKVEQQLLRAGIDVNADVLKVGHHGSNTSTSPTFLESVSPQTAVIQVGARNRYRHPAQTILSRLENSDINLYRTDTHGAVTLTSDGLTYLIEHE